MGHILSRRFENISEPTQWTQKSADRTLNVIEFLDQTASQDQSLFRHHRECSQNSDLGRHLGLCSGGHCKEDLEPRRPLNNG